MNEFEKSLEKCKKKAEYYEKCCVHESIFGQEMIDKTCNELYFKTFDRCMKEEGFEFKGVDEKQGIWKKIE